MRTLMCAHPGTRGFGAWGAKIRRKKKRRPARTLHDSIDVEGRVARGVRHVGRTRRVSGPLGGMCAAGMEAASR